MTPAGKLPTLCRAVKTEVKECDRRGERRIGGREVNLRYTQGDVDMSARL